jgi:hypothetical protein
MDGDEKDREMASKAQRRERRRVRHDADLTAVEVAAAHRRLDSLPDDFLDYLKNGPDWPSDRPELLGPREDERV